ncbi:hypothetical protein [Chryseobacterium populi]|uniref:Uncharacterized protein n=1 Tax=Chryseobacterium populi TaxID=1144316 RepID=J3CMD7_9FLAO|nr:hypothetical protein [Chryseobacterium populi]EJL74431.1 hypothetical protein PMI13_01171 [Chryseobacterium populi]
MNTKFNSGLKKLPRKEQLKITAGNTTAINDPVYGNGGGGTNNGSGSGNVTLRCFYPTTEPDCLPVQNSEV